MIVISVSIQCYLHLLLIVASGEGKLKRLLLSRNSSLFFKKIIVKE